MTSEAPPIHALSESLQFDRPPAVVVIPSPEVRPTALGGIRCLGRPGVPITAVSAQPRPPSLASKYVLHGFRCPNQREQEMEFIEFLVDLGRRISPKPMIYFASDLDAVIVSKHADALAPHYHGAYLSPRAMRLSIDKWEMLQTARKVGMDLPLTFRVSARGEIEEALKSARYPAIAKPLGRFRLDGEEISRKGEFISLFGTKGVRAADRGELRAVLEKTTDRGITVLVQEDVVGPPSELYLLCVYADKQSEVLGVFFGKKIRQFPCDFGSGTLTVPLPYKPELTSVAKAFVKEIGFHGIGVFEWKYDPRDRLYKFMEINPRCWTWTALCERVGVNLPYLQYLDLTGQHPAPVRQRMRDVKFIELYRDLVYFWRYRNGDHLGRKMTLWQYLDSIRGEKEYGYFAVNDRLPGFVHLHEQLRGLAGRGLKKFLRIVRRTPQNDRAS